MLYSNILLCTAYTLIFANTINDLYILMPANYQHFLCIFLITYIYIYMELILKKALLQTA